MNKSSYLKIIIFALILVFYSSLVTYKIKLPVADDLPRQIKMGEMITHGNFDVLYKNTFSYTQPEQNFFDHHWLSAVAFYLLYSTIGWGGLVVFKVIFLLSAFLFLFFSALKKVNFWLLAVLSIPTIIMLSERSTLRPEIFSYLFISVFLYLLIDFESHSERKRIFWLIPLGLLWVNMHIFFSIGIMLTAGFLLEKIIINLPHDFFEKLNWQELKKIKRDLFSNPLIKKLVITLLGLFIVSFINPRGIQGVFYHYPQNFPINIGENQSLVHFEQNLAPFENIPFFFLQLSAVFLVLSFIAGFKKKDKPIFYFLASFATLAVSFYMVRGIALFAIIFFLATSINLSDIFMHTREFLIKKAPGIKKGLDKIFVAGLMLILILLALPAGRNWVIPYTEWGLGLADSVQNATQFFKNNNLRGPIFNDADAGSYLIYNLYPKEKVFSDNRFADAYSASFFRDEYLAALEKEDVWLQVSKKYDFQSIFFYQYDHGTNIRDFLWRRLRDSAWSLVYVDQYNMIFIRNTSENKNILNKFAITKDNAEEKLTNLVQSENYDDQVTAADIFNLMGRVDLGMKTFLRVVARWPDKGKIWMTMGEWELTQNQYRSPLLAMMYLERAIAEGQRTTEAYSFLGIAYDRLNQPENAIKALRQSLKINPNRKDAKSLLFQLENSPKNN